MTSGYLSTIHIPQIEIIRTTEHGAAIYLWNKGDFTVFRREIVLKSPSEIQVFTRRAELSMYDVIGIRFHWVNMITGGKTRKNAVVCKIIIIQVVVFEVDKGRDQLILGKNIGLVDIFIIQRGKVEGRLGKGQSGIDTHIEQMELGDVAAYLLLLISQIKPLFIFKHQFEMLFPEVVCNIEIGQRRP